MKQTDKILDYMEKFGSITTMQAFADLGVTRLSARIHELIKGGYEIDKELIEGRNRFGDTIHFIKYRFADQEGQSA